MDLHPSRYELDFEDLKATEGYNPPKDFIFRELPLDAGGALPGREETKGVLWYEYPSPFDRKDWDPQLQEETERQLQLEEQSLRLSLEERERQREQLEVDMHWRRPVERERQHQEESQRQPQRQDRDLLRQEVLQLQLWLRIEEESLRLSLEEMQLHGQHYRRGLVESEQQDYYAMMRRQRLEKIERLHLVAMQWQLLDERQRQGLEDEWHRLQQEDDLYSDKIGTNSSTSVCWGSDDETTTYSSPARDAPEEHQFPVKEHQVHVKMYENDPANIPRYHLFKSEADTEDLPLKFPLKIPYYIYAGRCNLNLEGYELRYADFFPNFRRWNYTWVRPTTYEGDDQYVDFFGELMGEAEYINTKDRVLAKAIAIANRGFRKMLYFQIELAVGDCMMLLEDKEKFEQRCNLYGYIASEMHFKNQKYESVLDRIMSGHEVLRYELTELGSDANEDDASEMREFVDHLVRSIPIELPFTTRSDHVYKKWVSKQINLQYKPYFHLYLNYLVEKINMAQDLGLAPEDTS